MNKLNFTHERIGQLNSLGRDPVLEDWLTLHAQVEELKEAKFDQQVQMSRAIDALLVDRDTRDKRISELEAALHQLNIGPKHLHPDSGDLLEWVRSIAGAALTPISEEGRNETRD